MWAECYLLGTWAVSYKHNLFLIRLNMKVSSPKFYKSVWDWRFTISACRSINFFISRPGLHTLYVPTVSILPIFLLFFPLHKFCKYAAPISSKAPILGLFWEFSTSTGRYKFEFYIHGSVHLHSILYFCHRASSI